MSDLLLLSRAQMCRSSRHGLQRENAAGGYGPNKTFYNRSYAGAGCLHRSRRHVLVAVACSERKPASLKLLPKQHSLSDCKLNVTNCLIPSSRPDYTPGMKHVSSEPGFEVRAQSAISASPWVAGVVISAGFFCLALFFAQRPFLVDLPLAGALNTAASHYTFLDMFFYDLDHYSLFAGTLIMALVWFCWFASATMAEQAKILAGALVAFPVGMLSRFLQHALTTHPRPMYDPVLDFHAPSMVPPEPLNTWNSFPSDHATVFGALVVVILLRRPRLGWFLIPWFILIESARVYMGEHYPSDLLGGTALGSVAIFGAGAPWIIKLGMRAVRWERSSPPLFFMMAFFISTQIATLFSEVRFMAGGTSLLQLLRFW